MSAALQTLTISCGGRLATIEVAPDAYERSQAGAEDTEDIINVPRSIAGVDIVAFFKQHEPGIVRLSLRSKGRFDVQSVAAQLGGGGHPNAAGCTIRDNLENARHRVLPMLTSLLESAS
jgi:phosphoesterase RecJ-like protein